MPSIALRAHLPKFIAALNAEIDAAKKKGGQTIRIYDGQLLSTSEEGHLYQFKLEAECHAPDECDVRVKAPEQNVGGKIIAIEGLDIFLLLEEQINDPRNARLVIQLWYILENLRDRLWAISQEEDRPDRELFDLAGDHIQSSASRPPDDTPLPSTQLNKEQRRAVSRALVPGVHFLWGPPGTGKTTTIGQAAATAAARGSRVLIVAYSNGATDVAALATYKAAPRELQEPGGILRVGMPRHSNVRDHPTLTTMAVLRQLCPDLVERYEQLTTELRILSAKGAESDRIKEVRRERAEIRKQIRALEAVLARSCQVLCCTLARLAVWRALDDQRFDLVILDEASMASIPFAALAASSAERTAIYAGDFRQLPPVSLADDPAAAQWLQRSIFDHAGVDATVRFGRQDYRMVMLQEQYRMHPEIADRVSRYWYDRRLRSGSGVADRASKIAEREPYPGVPIQLLDISPLRSQCLREPFDMGHSRFNPTSALVAVALAADAIRARHEQVGIISPFRLQARLVDRMARDLKLERVKSSTVHRFQGDEVDVAIVDLTTASGHDKPGPLLDGEVMSTAGRLLNVAVSRAKGKLLVVADMSHVRRRFDAEDAVRTLLADFPVRAVSPSDLAVMVQRLSGGMKLLPVELVPGTPFKGLAAAKIGQATNKLFIALAADCPVPQWVIQSSKGGCEIVVSGAAVGTAWQRIPRTRIINRFAGFNVVFDQAGKCAIELPELGQTLIVRLRETAALLADLFRVIPDEYRRAALASPAKQQQLGPLGTSCSQCGGALWFADGRYGPQLQCTICHRTRSMDADAATQLLSISGIICPQCRALPQVKKGWNGWYVRCSRSECDWGSPLKNYV